MLKILKIIKPSNFKYVHAYIIINLCFNIRFKTKSIKSGLKQNKEIRVLWTLHNKPVIKKLKLKVLHKKNTLYININIDTFFNWFFIDSFGETNRFFVDWEQKGSSSVFSNCLHFKISIIDTSIFILVLYNSFNNDVN